LRRNGRDDLTISWETFPEWMNHIDHLPKAVNMMQLVPVTPLVSYVMGGWDEAKSRQPNESLAAMESSSIPVCREIRSIAP
jgi:N-acyl-D-aspartate/D-glutamate deacylase